MNENAAERLHADAEPAGWSINWTNHAYTEWQRGDEVVLTANPGRTTANKTVRKALGL